MALALIMVQRGSILFGCRRCELNCIEPLTPLSVLQIETDAVPSPWELAQTKLRMNPRNIYTLIEINLTTKWYMSIGK